MLSKNICKKCAENNIDYQWGDYDEYRWECKKQVWCPNGPMLSTFTKPPEHCPYKLEHLILNNVK